MVLHFIDDIQEKLRLLRNINNHLKPRKPFVLVSAYGDQDSAELHDRIDVWKSFFLDAGYENSKVDDMGKVIMETSSISEYLFQTRPIPPNVFYILSNSSTALVVLVLSIYVAERFAGHWFTNAIIKTGQMTLTH
ncbi:hypothetical protein BACCIP111895_03078 [Neobacillus rhizosphaerae]|uniref:Uncharacterized protein n=1 Tax=Neobacillus rhizosphaerae TaxID=2880965 RepID=A0ABM9ETB7_9BACI|nr:hypothetical protein BACCIP111895_03078 [Neobacillus rhizosphaerae]